MNNTTTSTLLGFIAAGLMVVGAIVPSALALTQTTTITSNDRNDQTNTDTANLNATQTNNILQLNAPRSTTTQSGSHSTEVAITNQNNNQSAAAINALSQSIHQSTANFHFSEKNINSTQSAVCAIVGKSC